MIVSKSSYSRKGLRAIHLWCLYCTGHKQLGRAGQAMRVLSTSSPVLWDSANSCHLGLTNIWLPSLQLKNTSTVFMLQATLHLPDPASMCLFQFTTIAKATISLTAGLPLPASGPSECPQAEKNQISIGLTWSVFLHWGPLHWAPCCSIPEKYCFHWFHQWSQGPFIPFVEIFSSVRQACESHFCFSIVPRVKIP